MSVVNQRLAQVAVGDLQRFEALSMVPLFADAKSELDYVLLDEAIADGSAVIEEVSESGSVPELMFRNIGSKPVFVVDGEELLGAKQNRIVNISIMVPAETDLKIPVSCVEAGRWSHTSRSFRTASRAHYAEGRARKMRDVNYSLRSSGARRSDQGRVWSEIDGKAERMQAHSDTAAAAAMYDSHRSSLDDYRKAFEPRKDQVGAIFLVEGHNHGIDLFDRSEVACAMHPKLVESYALDAIDFGRDVQKKETDASLLARAKSFLEQINEIQKQSFDAIGMGNDFRFEGRELTGGALEVNDQCVHLCAFRLEDEGEQFDEIDEQGRGIDRPRSRRSRVRRNLSSRR